MNLDWLAGFFDGEGGITLHPRSLTISVTLSNSDEFSLALVYKEFPQGKLTSRDRNINWKTAYEIRWNGKQALPLLEAIKDRVVVKKTKMQLAIKIINTE